MCKYLGTTNSTTIIPLNTLLKCCIIKLFYKQ